MSRLCVRERCSPVTAPAHLRVLWSTITTLLASHPHKLTQPLTCSRPAPSVTLLLQAADLKWTRAAFDLACDKQAMSASDIYNEVLPALDTTCPDYDVHSCPDYEADKVLPSFPAGPSAAVLAAPCLAPLAEVVPCPAAACAAPLAAPLASPKTLLSSPACVAAEAAVEKVAAVEEVAEAEVQSAKPIIAKVSLSSRLASTQPLFVTALF